MSLLEGHLNDKHHVRLEWMIIILIMVEVSFYKNVVWKVTQTSIQVLFEIVHYIPERSPESQEWYRRHVQIC